MQLTRFLVAGLLLICTPAMANINVQRDLVALHYDHAPDRDDGHAAASALAVVQDLGLNSIVVGGAYGRWNADRYDAASEAVMNAVWGGNWLNAHSDFNGALNASVARWLQVLDNGGDVWVAEGGQADFSAAVIRQIQLERPSVDTNSRIHIVQHSDWNEVHADQSDLDYARANTHYILIDDGNFSNGTADLNQRSQSFVDSVLASQYAPGWQAAFSYLDPNDKLDFSDTVELLYIVGIGTDQISSPDDFSARFIRNTQNAALAPTSPTYWSDSYSVGGQCYCDTNFDHDLDQVRVSTADGEKSVMEICAAISSRFGSGSSSGRTYYNTVQCGHQPANSAADERECPGFLTDSSGSIFHYNCTASGATWNLATLYGGASESGSDSGASGSGGHPVCQSASSDPDGDGYGWENNASCVVDANTGTDTGTSGGTSGGTANDDAGGHGICADASSDPDGDGYGWENGASCVVAAQSGDSGGSGGGSALPACALSGSDPDGDGYGWENGQSCIASSSDSGRETSSGRPVCVSSASDSDGDGYGWENNQTCIVQ